LPGQKRIQKPKPRAKRAAETLESSDSPQKQSDDAKRELNAEMDDLLDEIDSVLESNAQEFVQGFVQRGGQ
jgi:ubiquitin-like protein Pup